MSIKTYRGKWNNNAWTVTVDDKPMKELSKENFSEFCSNFDLNNNPTNRKLKKALKESQYLAYWILFDCFNLLEDALTFYVQFYEAFISEQTKENAEWEITDKWLEKEKTLWKKNGFVRAPEETTDGIFLPRKW